MKNKEKVEKANLDDVGISDDLKLLTKLKGKAFGVTTNELEECHRVLGWYLHGDDKVIVELLDPEKDCLELFHRPFTNELNNNLLLYESKEGKIDLIKHYMDKFRELPWLYSDNEDILFSGSLCNYVHEVNGKRRQLDKMEKYIVDSYDLFSILINEIQSSCLKYQIDFLKVCKELRFDTDLLIDLDTEHFPLKEELSSNTLQKLKAKRQTKSPESFEDIFRVDGWQKYIHALETTSPPLIDKEWRFIGRPRGHKGVIAAWMFELQRLGIISLKISGNHLARVVNNEIENLNLGKDGRTFYNDSELYINEFKTILCETIK